MSRTRGGLVKGKKFKQHVYVGDPINAVKVYNDKCVDEIAIFDIDATRHGRPPDFDWVQEICSEAFMPLGYGGGISRIEHVKELLQRGAEKVTLNSITHGSFRLVSEAAKLAGSQSVVVSIDVRRPLFAGYRVFTHAGTRDTGVDPVDFARRAEEAGAGEILLTSIEREGSFSGYDVELVSRVASAVGIPVIANGGAGTVDHFVAAVRDGGASAVAAGSMFLFLGRHRAVLISYPAVAELERFFQSVS
jgi:cyclase